MPYVDLPAHNVYANAVGSQVTVIGGPECLATTDTATGVILSAPQSGFYVGALDGLSGGGAALGFGQWTLPPGVQIVSIQSVAYGYREGGGPIPPGEGWSGQTDPPYESYPALIMDGTGTFTHYNISTLPVGAPGWAFGTFNKVAFDAPWWPVTTSEAHNNGFCPQVQADNSYPFPPVDIPIHLYYLAIRITYLGGAPPRRIYPRDDALTGGARRVYPPNKSQQRSNRVAGGYL